MVQLIRQPYKAINAKDSMQQRVACVYSCCMVLVPATPRADFNSFFCRKLMKCTEEMCLLASLIWVSIECYSNCHLLWQKIRISGWSLESTHVNLDAQRPFSQWYIKLQYPLSLSLSEVSSAQENKIGIRNSLVWVEICAWREPKSVLWGSSRRVLHNTTAWWRWPPF